MAENYTISKIAGMNEPTHWTQDDLLGLISNQTRENLNLDYKSSASLDLSERAKKELAKDVSAFANSAGGVIVYGIVEKDDLPDRLDEGCNPSTITKEWIDQVIATRIHPKIDGLAINQIPLKNSSSNGVAYVVVIPQSTTAHMASDHRYHKRRNTITDQMEDYEVRDVMTRESAPRLEATLKQLSCTARTLAIDVLLENNSNTLAEYCITQIIVPNVLQILNNGAANETESMTSDTGIPVTVLKFYYGGLNVMPIWQGLRLRLNKEALKMKAPQAGTYVVGWRITAPRMQFRTGNVDLVFTDGDSSD